MKKKITSTLLLIAMVISLSGCDVAIFESEVNDI